MNTENMRTLAAHIRRIGNSWVIDGIEVPKRITGYRQNSMMYHCGTPACIAGHAAALSGMGIPEEAGLKNKDRRLTREAEWLANPKIEKAAREWLDLTRRQASDLFRAYPPWAKNSKRPTAEEAATELERLADEAERKAQ